MDVKSVFKNEDVLNYDYLPGMLPHREGQIKQLSDSLNILLEGKRAQNVFIFGAPGIGKTASVKYVFREFESYSGMKTLYINCWEYSTATSVLSKITQELGYPAPRHGWSKDETVEKFIETFNKGSRSLVVCFDEADQLTYKDNSILYDLTRVNQSLGKPMMLIFISNNPHIFTDLEPRIKSTLNLEEIEFKPYTLAEMKDIMKQRTDLAFFSIETGVTLLVANAVLNYDSDVRVGLDCLLKAGRSSDEESSDRLKVNHVRQAVISLTKVKKRLLKERVGEHEKIIMKILESGREYSSSELYLSYCKETGKAVTERMFNNYIDHLLSLNLISVKRKEKIHGFTRVISKA